MPKWLEWVLAIVGIGGVIGIGLWVADVEWRLRALEAQATTKAVMPPTSNEAGEIIPADPIAAACAEVSRKLAEATEPVGFGTRIDAYKEHLSLLGCTDR